MRFGIRDREAQTVIVGARFGTRPMGANLFATRQIRRRVAM